MSNSIKFTPRNGTIRVTLAGHETKRRRQRICIGTEQTQGDALSATPDPEEIPFELEMRVRDSGPGISEEGMQRLFMDFGRLAEHEKRNKNGTGLGLSICKTLIEQMKGNISVESSTEGPDTGTTFIVRLKTKSRITNVSRQRNGGGGYHSIYEKGIGSPKLVMIEEETKIPALDAELLPNLRQAEKIGKKIKKRVLVADDNQFSLMAT